MDSQEITKDQSESHLKEDMLLRFRVGPFRFSVPAVEVEGIIVPPELTVIPLNPPHSKGVFMHQGRLASTISLRSKFGLPDHEDNNLGQLILGLVSVGLVAFWVDEVYETVDSTELEWREMPDFVPHDAFESFAAMGYEVILASTMQKLYDVPAEQVSNMLQGMRESYDLPEDVPPVASETFDAGELNDSDDDAFGELAGPDAETGSLVEDSAVGNDAFPAEVISKPGTAGVATNSHADGALRPQAENQGNTNKQKIVDLDTRRTKSADPTGGSANSAGVGTVGSRQQGGHRERDDAFTAARANAPKGSGNREVRPENTYGNHRPATVGGTYSRAVNRLQNRGRQTDRHHQDATTSRSPRFTSDRPQGQYYSRNPDYYARGPETKESFERIERSGQGKWWLLVLFLVLLILLAYWLWPTSRKQGVISTIPTQNYQAPPRFKEPETPASTEEAPTEVTEANDLAGSSAEAEPASSPTGTEPVVEPEAAASGEIYRLEGEEVTVTVERNKEAFPSPTANPEAVTKTGSLTPAYTEFVHVVVKGDTLWDIAAKYLQNPFRYPELARLSRINNPDLIYPGDTVRIRKKNR